MALNLKISPTLINVMVILHDISAVSHAVKHYKLYQNYIHVELAILRFDERIFKLWIQLIRVVESKFNWQSQVSQTNIFGRSRSILPTCRSCKSKL